MSLEWWGKVNWGPSLLQFEQKTWIIFLSDFAFRKLCGNLVEFHLLIKLYYSYCNEGNIWILGSYNLSKRKQLNAVNIVAFNLTQIAENICSFFCNLRNRVIFETPIYPVQFGFEAFIFLRRPNEFCSVHHFAFVVLLQG